MEDSIAWKKHQKAWNPYRKSILVLNRKGICEGNDVEYNRCGQMAETELNNLGDVLKGMTNLKSIELNFSL